MSSNETSKNKVPFDPGYAPYVLVFSTTYDYIQAEIRKFKNANQRKMKYKVFEPSLMKLCDNLVSFYFGCMLYGGYLKNKHQNSPKEIEGNDFFGANIEECQSGDVSVEVNSLAKFINSNDKNPFATRKINPKYTTIVNNYIEFLEENKYFTDVQYTSDIKIPKAVSFIDKFEEKDLDNMFQCIQDAIKAGKIEKLLASEYFEHI